MSKKKVTIYIDEDILKDMKILAIQLDCSLSELTESLYSAQLSKINFNSNITFDDNINNNKK